MVILFYCHLRKHVEYSQSPSWDVPQSFLPVEFSQSKSCLASLNYCLTLSGETTRARQALLYQSVPRPESADIDKEPLAFSSPNILPLKNCSVFVQTVLVLWIHTSSRGSSKSWLKRPEPTNKCSEFHFWVWATHSRPIFHCQHSPLHCLKWWAHLCPFTSSAAIYFCHKIKRTDRWNLEQRISLGWIWWHLAPNLDSSRSKF